MIVGETTDGKMVVAGVFKMYDTVGLPLADIFERLTERNMIPSFPHFYDEAIAAGWKHKTIILRLREALADSHGSEFANVVCERLETYGKET
jgi:hypothetical protein